MYLEHVLLILGALLPVHHAVQCIRRSCGKPPSVPLALQSSAAGNSSGGNVVEEESFSGEDRER